MSGKLEQDGMILTILHAYPPDVEEHQSISPNLWYAHRIAINPGNNELLVEVY